jgi:hypothetical protein
MHSNHRRHHGNCTGLDKYVYYMHESGKYIYIGRRYFYFHSLYKISFEIKLFMDISYFRFIVYIKKKSTLDLCNNVFDLIYWRKLIECVLYKRTSM